MKFDYFNGSNIVSLGPVRAEALFPAIARVEAYWEGLRNGRPMPTRIEVDPRGLADVLEFAFVLEKIAPGVARTRLAGLHLNELMDMEVRGMPITAMFLPEARETLKSVLAQVTDDPAVARLSLETESGLTRPRLEAQMILLPLKDAKGQVTRILGCLQSKGRIGRGPRRFRITEQDVAPILVTPAPVYACDEERAPARHEAAEPTQLFRHRAPAETTGLRLVHDADAE